MPKAVCIIEGHPDPAGGHFCNALADAYAEGAKEAGHAVERIRIAQLDFPFLRSQADYEKGETPGDIRGAQDKIKAADHIVIVYPLWLGTLPALLKAFLEQTFRPGFALDYGDGNWPKKMLKNKSARIVVTMGMPALAYRWFYGAHSLKSLERNILKFCGIRPVRETVIGMVFDGQETNLKKQLVKVRRLGGRGI